MDRQQARRALDKRFISLPLAALQVRPHRGWIKAIREALGMSAAQLGQRMGVSQPRVTALEQAEIADSVTLESLRRAAEALDCVLVYAIVPRTSLEDIVKKRACVKATEIINRVNHTMILENQNLEVSELKEEIDTLAQNMINSNYRHFWDKS